MVDMEEVITRLSGAELAPKSGAEAKQVVILLHGLGSDGNDLISLAPEFAHILPDAHFISPNAPFNCDMSPFGYQWFSMTEWTEDAMKRGVRDAAPILSHFIDETLERFGLSDDKLVLAGFSQGTIMSLYVGMRREKPCAGILGYSGIFLNDEDMQAEIRSRPDICLVHGMMDPVVPYMFHEQAVKELKAAGCSPEAHSRPMLAHSIDSKGIEIGRNFLDRVLGFM